MAATHDSEKSYPQIVQDRITASKGLAKLIAFQDGTPKKTEAHANDIVNKDDESVFMTGKQVDVALRLLNKVAPDKRETAIDLTANGKLEVVLFVDGNGLGAKPEGFKPQD